MIKVKPIKKQKKSMIRSYDYIKSKAGSYKSCNTESYFISDGQGTVLYLDSTNVICRAIDGIWSNKEFIEVDCSIVFTLPKKDENAIKN